MVEKDPEDSSPPISLPQAAAADLQVRAEQLSSHPLKSTTDYMAVIYNEQKWTRRIGRWLGLRNDEVEALVRWHLHNVLLHTRAQRTSGAPSEATYGVVVRKPLQSRRARILFSVSRSLFSWLPSFTSNRKVELRAMYLRLTRQR